MLLSILNNKSLSKGNTVCTASDTNNKNSYSTAKPTLPSSNLNLPAFAATAPKVFLNPGLERKEISSFLKGKTGIYCFWNKSNGKFY